LACFVTRQSAHDSDCSRLVCRSAWDQAKAIADGRGFSITFAILQPENGIDKKIPLQPSAFKRASWSSKSAPGQLDAERSVGERGP